jgi:hypothetical protein
MSLVDQRSEWKSRSHFLAIAVQTMRSIGVDNARAQRSGKRGAGAPMVPPGDPLTISANQPVDLVLNTRSPSLPRSIPKAGQIVNSSFSGGLSNTKRAQLQWAGARVWLYHELSRRRED